MQMIIKLLRILTSVIQEMERDDMSERLVIKKRGDDGYKTFSIRIKNETIDKIDVISKESNLSRNQLIQEMLDFAVEKIDIK